MRRTPTLCAVCVCALLGAMTSAPGCAVIENKRTAAPGPRYPSTLPRGEVYDVQVFRRVKELRFTNTTPRDFGPSRLWVNQRYSHDLPNGFTSGETLTLDLRDFVDEFGETYRAGGFFAVRTPAPVVLVQIETIDNGEPAMHGFIIVENELQ